MDGKEKEKRRIGKVGRNKAHVTIIVILVGTDCDYHSTGIIGTIKRGGKYMRKKAINFKSKAGMELVQVAILVALAVALGLIFKTGITDFVNRTFEGLNNF